MSYLSSLRDGEKIQTLDLVASWPLPSGWRIIIGRRGDGGRWVGRAMAPDGQTALRVEDRTALRAFRQLLPLTGRPSRGRRTRLPRKLDGRMVRPSRVNRRAINA
jgi:hypothetical protein